MNIEAHNEDLFFALLKNELSENIMLMPNGELLQLVNLSLNGEWVTVKAILSAMMGIPEDDFELSMKEIHKECLEIEDSSKLTITTEKS
jgi:hypothetical protein